MFRILFVAGLMLAGLSPGVLLAVELAGSEPASHSIPHPSPTGGREPAMSAGDAAQPEAGPSDEDNFFVRHIEGKLQFGTRSVHRLLTNSDSGAKGGTQGSGTFLGTIYALDEEQNYLPIQPFLTYYANRYIGFELAYDSMEAKTIAYSSWYSSIKTDGNVRLSGPTLSLLGRYPNATAHTPYAGIGLGFFTGDFDEDPSWQLGYPDPSVYENLGSPGTIYNGRYREIVVEDTIAFLLTAGATWQFHPNWAADFSVQYVKAKADATFFGYTDEVLDTVQPGSFPLDNLAIRAGIVYQF